MVIWSSKQLSTFKDTCEDRLCTCYSLDSNTHIRSCDGQVIIEPSEGKPNRRVIKLSLKLKWTSLLLTSPWPLCYGFAGLTIFDHVKHACYKHANATPESRTLFTACNQYFTLLPLLTICSNKIYIRSLHMLWISTTSKYFQTKWDHL